MEASRRATAEKSTSKSEPCQVNADYFFRLWGSCALRICSNRSDDQQRILRWSSEKIAWCCENKTTAFLVKRWLGCSQNWKWRSKESGSTTSRRFRVMRRASWRLFRNLRSRAALRCGSTARSVWFNQMWTTSKDATVRMTKNSTKAEIWTQVGYFSDTPRIYIYIFKKFEKSQLIGNK